MSPGRSSVVRLANALVDAPDRRTALQIARSSGNRVGEPLARHVLEQFNKTLWDEAGRPAGAARAIDVIASVSGDEIARAIDLRVRGVLERKAGRLSSARRLLQRAARAFADAGSFMDAGDVYRILVDILILAEADDDARQAVRQARQSYARAGGAGATRRASLAMNLGNLHHRRDDHGRALKAYDEARRLYREARDSRRLAYADFNRANILTSCDRTQEARRSYEQARRAFVRQKQPTLVAQADCALAGLDLLEGRPDACVRRIEEIIDRHRDLGYGWGLAHAELDAADAYLQLNRCADVLRTLRRAETYFRKSDHRTELALCSGIRGGVALREARPAHAARFFARGRDAQERLGNPVGAASLAIGEAQATTAAGRPLDGVALARRAASVFRRRGLRSREARALSVGATAALAAGRIRQARTWAEQALKLVRSRRDHRVELAALMALAEVEQRSGKPSAAYRKLLAAERRVDKLRRGITSEESRLAFALDKSEVYEALIRNRLQKGDRESIRQALVFAERGKARALAERLATCEIDALVGPGAAKRKLGERLARIERDLAVAETRLSSVNQPGLRSAGPARIRALTESQAQTRKRLARLDPGRATLIGAAPVDPLGIIDSLGANELILEYAETDGFMHLFCIDADGVEVFQNLVSIARLREAVAMLRFHLGKSVLGSAYIDGNRDELAALFRAHFETLHGWLLGPVVDRLDGKSIRIVPHGILHGLPFHAFEARGIALADRCLVSYAPSLTTMTVLRRRKHRAGASPIVLGAADHAAPLIDREVDIVRRHIRKARVFRGSDGAADALRLSERSPTLLHVASHGFYSDRGPRSSGLMLGDAWVSLTELYGLQATADLVVLSGCETGRGTVYSGDEWVGLVSGFLQAGARSIVASLWKVDDRVTLGLMKEFYRGLARGLNVSEALGGAQRRSRIEDPLPLSWAPFVVIGEPTLTVASAATACSGA